MSPLLSWEGVRVRYGDLVAVEHIDLAVHPGEVVGLIGANGAGKTTTIRAGLGLLRPTAGTVQHFGGRPTRRSRARVGYVSQTLGLWPDLTVAENARFVTAAFGTGQPDLSGDLALHAGAVVRDLPLGLQRRAAFEIVLAHRPEALVLDEPTSGVDALARAALWDRVRRESDRGVGVLVTTHGMDEARQCDRLVVLAEGRVVAAGTEHDLVGGLAVVEVVGERWDVLLEALEREGCTVALRGARLRVVGEDPSEVRERLDRQGCSARMQVVRATLDEAVAALGRRP